MIVVEHSWVLFLLPTPLLMQLLFPVTQQEQSSALKIPFLHQLQKIVPRKQSIQSANWQQLVFQTLLWSLLVIAASNPLWFGKPIALDQKGRDLLLAVDVSGSMEIDDMQWKGKTTQRLDVVKSVAKDFIEARKNDRIGLILFGTQAYVQSPLTFDRQTVLNMLDDASVGLAGERTAIGDAIGLAIKRLQNSKQTKKVLILLTDGVNNAGHVGPIEAAEMAKKYGIHIYTIGLGANISSMINPFADLDEKTLREIAKETGGLYFRAHTTTELQKVYKEINKVEAVTSEKVFFRPQTVLYPYLLLMALALLLIGGKR